jgi:tRNA modification GTPase
MQNDTITAIATAYGVGSIAIVRVSGPKSLQIAKQISKKENFTPRLATLCKLYSQDDLIDEALIIYFKAPYSFTGEDIIEFQCHGGVAIAKIIIDEVIKCGARLANSGEFTKRAFLNGKIDISKAETISKLIESTSQNSVKLIAKHLKGDLKNFVNDIRERLINILAYSEVSIDYADEDLPDDIFQAIEKQIENLVIKLQNTLSSSKRRENIINGLKVAIIGKPNVGKSSLLNKLLNYERAIVSNIAGTTRDTIEETITIGTNIIKIVDTAGIRNTNDTIEKIGIEKSKSAIEEADIVISLFNNNENLNNEDYEILNILKENIDNKNILIFINKSDLDTKIEEEKLKDFDFEKISCKDDVNIVVKKLETIVEQSSVSDEILLISKRQIDAVENCINSIEEARDNLSAYQLEIFAFHINEAIENISTITKEYDNDEMFDKMFSTFCLGK